MTTSKYIIVFVILSTLLLAEITQAAPAAGHKKSRQQAKPKKSMKASFKTGILFERNQKLKKLINKIYISTAPANNNSVQHRSAKMNVYSPRSWPSTNNYYHTASSPMYLRSAPSTLYYPMRWFNSPNYFTSGSMMPTTTTYLRRADDFPSMNTVPTMNPSSLSSSLMGHESSSRTPTLIDLSAFGGSNGGLLDNTFSSQHLWSLPETTLSTSSPKSKMNLFNSFSLNDDEGFFNGLFNQFK